MPKLMVAQHGDILILAQGNDPLDANEFTPIEEAFVNAFRENNYRIRMVAFSDRAMDAAQRKRALNAGWDRGKSQAVVVTRDMLVRSSVTALSWFGVPVRSASPSQYRAILASYLRFRSDELAMIESTLRRLRMRISGEAPTIDAILKGQLTREFRASE